MHRLYAIDDDFEASIRIYTQAEGGRDTAPFNGIRWDFSYALDNTSENLYMIWPDFYGPSGESLSVESPLPVGIELPARMVVVIDEMREQTHRGRITPGIEFYCREGARKVAIGRVTRITGLNRSRASKN